MNSLIKEIKILISLHFDDVFYNLYLVDNDIREYAHTPEGNYNFQKIAIKETKTEIKTIYTLFGKLHNIDDKPAIIYHAPNSIHNMGKLMKYCFNTDNYKPSGTCNYSTLNDSNIIYMSSHNPSLIPKVENEQIYDIKFISGAKLWYKNNKLHRDNLPAIIHSNGKKEYYQNDIFISTNDI